ncbi:Na+/H+ antiporter NhaA [Teredinibacter turnerae]|uniref:Na+/H+ antiporter NhaA n=1 Tax=Teredinibacter turnerae TaxID=2426 RepID=UPI00035C46F2|nr:Na+/H+ antiporter NhaA [Teredinibacter turnerae]
MTHPVSRFFKIEAAAGLLLLFFTLLALILANSPLSDQFENIWKMPLGVNFNEYSFERTLHDWINDALMTLFFFLIALELKREIVLGDFSQPRLAMLSISAAAGGMLVPALIYSFFQYGELGQHGWGTVMATDTAFVIGGLALLGKRIPRTLRVFMLSLAVVDDIGAILVVALGYGSQLNFSYVALSLFGFVVIRLMALAGIRSIGLFFGVGGVIWLCVDASGIHATVAGVILGLMTPTNKWVSDERLHKIVDCIVPFPPGEQGSGDTHARQVLKTAEAAAREALSPVERLEIMLHPWVSFAIMPLFAFANAGIDFANMTFSTSISLAVFLGFLLGKPIGIFLFSWLAVRLRIAILPNDLNWPLVFSAGILAGIGFTMAIFIANLAFEPELIASAKLGILLASLSSGILGISLLFFLTRTNHAECKGTDMKHNIFKDY